jgi:hypothetical protein
MLLDHATFLSVIAVSFSTLLGRVAGEVNELGGEGLCGDWSVVGGSQVDSISAASNLAVHRFLGAFGASRGPHRIIIVDAEKMFRSLKAFQ